MKKALLVYGGWEEHTPRKSMELLAPRLEEAGFALTRAESLEVYDDPGRLEEVDLVVQCWTFGRLTPEQEKALVGAVAGGTGFAGWHGGVLDAFRENPDYQFMTGGQWVAHPGGVIDYRVKVTDHDDPVTRGLSDFNMHSEQYYLHVDPGYNVLATTTFTGKHGAYIQMKLQSLADGHVETERFSSSQEVEKAFLEARRMQYLYQDGPGYVFMDPGSGDQVTLSGDVLADVAVSIVEDEGSPHFVLHR